MKVSPKMDIQDQAQNWSQKFMIRKVPGRGDKRLSKR